MRCACVFYRTYVVRRFTPKKEKNIKLMVFSLNPFSMSNQQSRKDFDQCEKSFFFFGFGVKPFRHVPQMVVLMKLSMRPARVHEKVCASIRLLQEIHILHSTIGRTMSPSPFKSKANIVSRMQLPPLPTYFN